MKPARPVLSKVAVIGLLAVIVTTGLLLAGRTRWYQGVPFPQIIPQRLTRPYGMAPVAWNAFLRACQATKIHPNRIGQTIGDHQRSVGYHKRDGVLRVGKEKIDYTTAVDLGTWDLKPAQINAFVEALTAQGFAAFYRHKGKWKGNEHIHAIYTFLPMKPQLQVQVREFLRDRRRAGKSPKWRAKLRSQESKLKHWMIW